MLDSLLVLGQVPGTNLKITFTEALLAALAVGCILLWLARYFSKKHRTARSLALIRVQAYLQLISLESTSVRLIRRTVEVHRADISSRQSYLEPRQAPRAERSILQARYPLRRQAV